jgi:hypothetical protein
MSLFVQTAAYGIALDVLKAHNYCVISGIPGIGKTTLAQVLVTRLLEDGFELIAVRDDINEAFELLDLNKRQVVYYDDFLGRSSLGDRTYTFCVNEIDVITGNADSGSQAEGWFGEVKEAAEAWGFSFEAEQKKMERWIAEKESRGASDDEWEGGGSGRSDPSPDGTDRDLDRLFGSLASREH